MRPDRFIHDNTAVATPPLVPEIRLHLATEVTPLWHATAELLDDSGVEPPFWAFAWPGGQAVARYILDHPETVADKRVLDFAAGSGIGAVAAVLAGAASVTAADTDPFAIEAIAMNARVNGVTLDITSADLTTVPGAGGDWEVVLAGDVFYDRAMAAAVEPFLFACARSGATVLAGDPGRTYLPTNGLVRFACYDVATSLDLEDRTVRETTVWRLVEPGVGASS